jgi:hypothetical protein
MVHQLVKSALLVCREFASDAARAFIKRQIIARNSLCFIVIICPVVTGVDLSVVR